MSLARRIHRLEVDTGSGTCPECGGKGILCVSTHTEGEPDPIPKGCPTCGEVKHLVIEFKNESLHGQPIAPTSTLSSKEMWDLHT